MIRNEIKSLLKSRYPGEDIEVDYVPKEKKGDYSTNLAFKLAAKRKADPMKLAEKIASEIRNPMICNITICEPGFINFEISQAYLIKYLTREERKINIGKGAKILIEFVSANPTGPVNIVSARAAAIGDSLVRVLNDAGFKATAEYYVNDMGKQTELLAESVIQRINQIHGKPFEIPEGGYHGEYLIDVAKEIVSRGLEKFEDIRNYTVHYFVEKHRAILTNFGVEFTNWVYESEIYKRRFIERVLKILEDKNLTFHKDGALYFKASELGDTKDRVIIKSDHHYHYRLSDIAYHLEKIERKYDKLINIWGPDHHGHILGLTGGIKALGYPEDILNVLIVQEVKIKKAGKFVGMSKRAGTFTTLDELLELVPKDVVRFFFLMRSCSQHLDFDIDLALKQTDENPVYYVQYAHARIKSIIKFAQEKGIDYDEHPNLSRIGEQEEMYLIKNIIKFPEVLEDTVRGFEPYMIAYYLIDLARSFHYFYQKHRVVGEDKELAQARLFLIQKTAETIKQGLELLGISCPEKM